MNCKDVEPLLVDYAENDLPRGLRREVEGHLDRCFACMESLHEVVDALDTARHALRHPDPRPQYARLLAQLEATPASADSARHFTVGAALKTVLALAATIIIILGTVHLLTMLPTANAVVRTTQIEGEPQLPALFPAAPYRVRIEEYMDPASREESQPPHAAPATEKEPGPVSMEWKRLGIYYA